MSQAQWLGHLLAQHPELAPHLAAVESTLADATTVTYDTRTVIREKVYRLNALPVPLNHLYLKVCVECGAGIDGSVTSGVVITAYPIPAVKRGEATEWL